MLPLINKKAKINPPNNPATVPPTSSRIYPILFVSLTTGISIISAKKRKLIASILYRVFKVYKYMQDTYSAWIVKKIEEEGYYRPNNQKSTTSENISEI